jgi:hypothetical protein
MIDERSALIALVTGLSCLLNFYIGYRRGWRDAVSEHNARVEEMGRKAIGIVDELDRKQRAKLLRLESELRRVARLAGVTLPADPDPSPPEDRP